MSSVVEDINEKHMQPWADAWEHDGIKTVIDILFIGEHE